MGDRSLSARCLKCRSEFNRAASEDKLYCQSCQKQTKQSAKAEASTQRTLQTELEKVKVDGKDARRRNKKSDRWIK